MSSLKKKGFLGTPNNPYAKTELCKNYPNCRFGDLCAFAHGENDLRCKTLHEMQVRGKIPCAQKYRCYPCMNFVSTGSCPYRHRCVFLHDPRIITDEKDQIYVRSGETNFRVSPSPFPASSSKHDMIQWPANKQKFDENVFINTTDDEVVEYTAPDQHAFSQSRLPWTIFCIWSGFVDELIRLKGSQEKNSIQIFDSDPLKEFFVRRTADQKEIKVVRLDVFLKLTNEGIITVNDKNQNGNFADESLVHHDPGIEKEIEEFSRESILKFLDDDPINPAICRIQANTIMEKCENTEFSCIENNHSIDSCEYVKNYDPCQILRGRR